MFRIRYKKATGEIVEWGEHPAINDDEYEIIEEQDDDLAQYLTLACSVANKALVVKRTKIDEIKSAKPLEIEVGTEVEASGGVSGASD